MCGGSLEGLVAAAWLCSASLHPAAALNEALSRPPGGPRVARGPLHPCQMAHPRASMFRPQFLLLFCLTGRGLTTLFPNSARPSAHQAPQGPQECQGSR